MTALTNEQRIAWRKLKDPDFGRVLKDNPGLIKEMRKARSTGKVTQPLATFMNGLANEMLNHPNFKPYTFRNDMGQYALLMMLKCWTRFDETKSNNPIGYLEQVCKSAVIQYIHKERRQQEIKKDLEEQQKNGRSD